MIAYKNLNLNQVKNLASEFARQFKNRGAVIGLAGTLGSGKTTFIKSFASAFRISEVTSPTFVIVHEYPIAQRVFYHIDLYRLKVEKELVPLGLPDMVKNKNLVLIEWVDRFPQLMRQCDILISFKHKPGNKRDVIIKTR